MRRAATKHAIMVRGSHENAAGPRTPILSEGKGRVRARRRPARRASNAPQPPCLVGSRSCMHFFQAAAPCAEVARYWWVTHPSPSHVNKPAASQRVDASSAYPDNIDYFINRISAK